MCMSGYWEQFSSDEIDQMHGATDDIDDDYDDSHHDWDDGEEDQEGEEPSLELYGMSWRDFR